MDRHCVNCKWSSYNCSVARDKYDTPNYHLCGLEGKFFEKNTDNSR